MRNAITAHWQMQMTAVTSIVHRDDTRVHASSQAQFRREKIRGADGTVRQVPVVSGNAWRGVLRRLGEEMLAPVLDYDGHLSAAAAHLLRNGGALHKTNTPLTPPQQRDLKRLVPLLSLFGGVANGQVMSGCLTVSKVLPVCAEIAHLMPGIDAARKLPAITTLLGEESYSHFGDHAEGIVTDDAATAEQLNPLLRYDIETLIAGTQLTGTLRLTNGSELDYAFLQSLVDQFSIDGHLGGRVAVGHGRIALDHIEHVVHRGTPAEIDWIAEVGAHRDEARAALAAIR